MRLRSDTHKPTRRLAAGFVASVFAASVLAATAATSVQAANAGGPYSGYSNGSIVHVDALTTSGTRVADVEVGIGSAQVNSEGLTKVHNKYQRLVVPNATSAKNAGAYSSILEAGAVLTPVDHANLVAPFSAESFDNDTPVDRSVLRQTVSPLAFVDLLNNKAATQWNGDACVIGEPIATGEQRVTRLDAVETGDNPSTPQSAGFDAPLVSLDGFSAGPRRGVSDIISRQWLYQGSSGNFGLYSVTATTLAPVTLFGGTPDELTIEADGPAYLVSRADGSTSGAVVAYHAPIVSVIQNSTATTLLPDKTYVFDLPDSSTPLVRIRIGTIEPLMGAAGIVGKTELANGTKAAAQANVVEVTLLDGVGGLAPGATIALGHMEASATVPAGGITCNLPVTKVASPSSVKVGSPFTTTITITNPYACDLSNVSLHDAIRTQSASRFAFNRTTPSVGTVSGSNLATGSASWAIGSIAAGKAKSVAVVLGAQGGAGKILDTATATGTLTNCKAKPASAGADVTGLAAVAVPVVGVGSLNVGVANVLGTHISSFPKLGMSDHADEAAGLGLLLLAAGLAYALRRRRAA